MGCRRWGMLGKKGQEYSLVKDEQQQGAWRMGDIIEESPRNPSHLGGLGATNMEKPGQGSASPGPATIIFPPIILLSACQILA